MSLQQLKSGIALGVAIVVLNLFLGFVLFSGSAIEFTVSSFLLLWWVGLIVATRRR